MPGWEGGRVQTLRKIAWHAIDVYVEYREKGFSAESAREKATQEVLECYTEREPTATPEQ